MAMISCGRSPTRGRRAWSSVRVVVRLPVRKEKEWGVGLGEDYATQGYVLRSMILDTQESSRRTSQRELGLLRFGWSPNMRTTLKQRFSSQIPTFLFILHPWEDDLPKQYW
jgi:hypothetical protein